MKSRIIGGAIACCVLAFAGCENNEQPLTWRRDVSPIVKRIPALLSCTNMLWHGENITKNSFMSIPGPSMYRVFCIVPDASRVIQPLLDEESTLEAFLGEVAFQPAEKAMLKSKYGIDLCKETGIVNERLKCELLQSRYRGHCIFFKAKDVLCIIFYAGG